VMEADEKASSAWWRVLAAGLLGAFLAGIGALLFAIMDRISAGFIPGLWASAPWAVFIIMPLGLGVILWLRDRVFPWTDGTGIPQTIAALQAGQGELRDRLLSLRVAAGKALLTSLGLLSMLSIGREGPSVQLGACFMQWAGRLALFPRQVAERGLIMAGGAAGIAAAFNAPIAGMVFAFEEIGRRFDKGNLGTILRTVVVACAVCAVVLGNGFFYGRVDYGRALPLEFSFLGPWLAVVVTGLCGGLLGGLFAKAMLSLSPAVHGVIRRRPWTVALIVGLACGAIAFWSDGASLGTGRDQARALILRGSPDYLSALPLAEREALGRTLESVTGWYALQRAAATFLVLLTGIPGGLFDPSFSIGAGLGHLTAPLLAATGASPQAVILLFIVAYFAGVVQSPMTSVVILVEMTGSVAFTLPLLAAALIAYEVSRRIVPVSLYEAMAQGFLRTPPRELG